MFQKMFLKLNEIICDSDHIKFFAQMVRSDVLVTIEAQAALWRSSQIMLDAWSSGFTQLM